MQGLNPHLLQLLHCQADSVPLCRLGSPMLLVIVSYDSSYFCGVHCNFFFISNHSDLSSSPNSFFFWMTLANILSIWLIFSKNQFLVALIFSVVLFISMSFISALVFTISFLLLTLGFVCSSFSSCLRCKLRCKLRLFICDFSYFLQ